MTTTGFAMPALPAPRQQVVHLRPRPDLERRPAGRHLAEVTPDREDHFLAEAVACVQGADAAYDHGRRCACCTPAHPAAHAAS